MDIRGLTVHEVWIEGASEIAAEYYASVVFDRSARAPLVLLSTKGGIDIEQVAGGHLDALARLHVDPLLGFQGLHAAPTTPLTSQSTPTSCIWIGALLPRSCNYVRRRGADVGQGRPADRQHRTAGVEALRREGHARRRDWAAAARRRGATPTSSAEKDAAGAESAPAAAWPTSSSTATSGSSATAPGS